MRLLLIDNHDSFTWNLAHYLDELGASVTVCLNDELEDDGRAGEGFDAIVLSPGPGRPSTAGATPRVVEQAIGRIPLLGVCLGHQAIAEHHGARIVRGRRPVHGRTSEIHHDGRGLYHGLPERFHATRYHSLVVDRPSLPPELQVAAWTDDGVVMGIRHVSRPAYGVQFHPESILTAQGKPLLRNFLEQARDWWQATCPAPRFRSM